MSPKPKPGILDISPYVGGKAHAPGVERVFKLSSNESALGPSEHAIQAVREADLDIYPEGSAKLLRETIAEVHGLDPARIVCGNGSDEILTMLAGIYVQPGDEVLFSEHGFLVYKIAALSNSAVTVIAPEKELRTDVDKMLAAVTPRTKLVYLSNPNNPTGSYISDAEVRRLHAGLSPDTLLVIDAAYAEYVGKDDYAPGEKLVEEFENVVMTRTFSKIYALAGLRVGWGYCPPAIADALNRVRGPFNVSVPAQRAAVAALKDRHHVEASIGHNNKWRAWLTEEIRSLGLRVDDSVGNFILIHFPATGPHTRDKTDEFLTSCGVILRPVGAYGLPNCLRLTVGSEEANNYAMQALADFMSIE